MFFRLVSYFSVMLALFFFVQSSSSHLLEKTKAQSKVVTLPPFADLSPDFLKILSLGHKGVYDVVVSVWITQILNDPDLVKINPVELVDFTRKVAKHKPQTPRTLYSATCFTFLKVFQRPDLCFPVIKEGIDTVPDSWILPVIQGYVEGSILKNPERSGFFYVLAAQNEFAPEYVKSVAKKFREKTNGKISDSELLRSMEMILDSEEGSGLKDFLIPEGEPKN